MSGVSYFEEMEKVLDGSGLPKDVLYAVEAATGRVFAVDERKTFAYTRLADFQRRVPSLQRLMKAATETFEPFAAQTKASLCSSMGVPLSQSLDYAKSRDRLKMFSDLFLVTGLKVNRFAEEALRAAMSGEKSGVPKADYTGRPLGPKEAYNVVFDRDSSWTPWNEVSHMASYARYHFNSYVIYEAMKAELGVDRKNPFDPVMSLYENGAADFIFVQTVADGVAAERLCTMYPVESGKRFLGVLLSGERRLEHGRMWGEHYHSIRRLDGKPPKIEIVGVADQRYLPAEFS